MADCVVFGAGGLACGVIDTLDAEGRHRVVAVAGFEARSQKELLGKPVWPEADILSGRGPAFGVVAIGDNFRRQVLVERILSARPGFSFVSAIHPRAYIAPSAKVGPGSVLMAGSLVGPRAVVGEHVVLYSNAIAEHDAVLGDYVTLAPAAALGGTVEIGNRTFVGMGAVVIHGVSVGADVVIAAQACVTTNQPAEQVLVGAPAQAKRSRRPGESYL